MPEQTDATIGFNVLYFKTFHAVVKLLETVFCFSAFISSLIATLSYDGRWSYLGAAYVDSISIIGAVVSGSVFSLSLFGVWRKIPAKCRNLLEAIFGWLWTIFLLAAAVVTCQYSLAINALMSAAIFCILAIIVYSSDATGSSSLCKSRLKSASVLTALRKSSPLID